MDKKSLIVETKQPAEPEASAELSPSDHVRMLVDLLQPVGPERARRWLAALTLVPEEEREDVIQSVEAAILKQYGDHDQGGL